MVKVNSVTIEVHVNGKNLYGAGRVYISSEQGIPTGEVNSIVVRECTIASRCAIENLEEKEKAEKEDVGPSSESGK